MDVLLMAILPVSYESGRTRTSETLYLLTAQHRLSSFLCRA